MVIFLADIVAIAALGFIVLRRGRDRRAGSTRAAHWLRIGGLVPLGLQVAVFLPFGVGEMAGGDLSGAVHLLQAAVPTLLGILAWMRPLEGGAALCAVGVVDIATSFFVAESPPIMMDGVPQVVSGALFLVSGMLTRDVTTRGPGRGQLRRFDALSSTIAYPPPTDVLTSQVRSARRGGQDNPWTKLVKAVVWTEYGPPDGLKLGSDRLPRAVSDGPRRMGFEDRDQEGDWRDCDL